MANTFYIKQGANQPNLVTTLQDEVNQPIFLDGSVVMRLRHPFYGMFDYTGIIQDQNTPANQGKVVFADVGLKPNSMELMESGNYKCEFRYTDSLGNLSIYPTEESSYDVPITDLVVIQRAL